MHRDSKCHAATRKDPAMQQQGRIQSHSAVRRESAMDDRTPNNWSNAIQNVRRSNDRHAKSIPAETGIKTHKELNINISQIFPIEVGCAKV